MHLHEHKSLYYETKVVVHTSAKIIISYELYTIYFQLSDLLEITTKFFVMYKRTDRNQLTIFHYSIVEKNIYLFSLMVKLI